jgi:hypothetical protein
MLVLLWQDCVASVKAQTVRVVQYTPPKVLATEKRFGGGTCVPRVNHAQDAPGTTDLGTLRIALLDDYSRQT